MEGRWRAGGKLPGFKVNGRTRDGLKNVTMDANKYKSTAFGTLQGEKEIHPIMHLSCDEGLEDEILTQRYKHG